MKLRALSKAHGGRPIEAHINCSPNHATVGYLNLVPFISKAVQSDRAPFDIAKELPPHHRFPRWSTLKGCANWNGFDYVLVANGHLERGESIETWLPELAAEYSYTLNITRADRNYISGAIGSRRVLLYLSGLGPNAGFHGNSWSVRDWVQVIEWLQVEGHTPVVVGADTPDDRGYSDWLFRTLTPDARANVDWFVGKTTIPQYCAAIEDAAVWIGLNSGGGIVSAMRGTPTVMLWSDSTYHIPGVDRANALHPNMKTNWLHEDQLKTYRTLSYGSRELTPARVVREALAVIRT